MLAGQISVHHTPPGHRTFTHTRGRERDTGARSWLHELRGMLSQKQVREEANHSRLLYTLHVSFCQRLKSERVTGGVDDVIDFRSGLLKQGNDVRLESCFIAQVTGATRNPGCRGWIGSLELSYGLLDAFGIG